MLSCIRLLWCAFYLFVFCVYLAGDCARSSHGPCNALCAPLRVLFCRLLHAINQNATIPKDWFDENRDWIDDSYGPQSNLMECKFRWKAVGGDFPKLVCGDYYVAPKWQGVYPQKDYGGHFEIPIDAIDTGDGNVDWVAARKGPPGTCNYKFIMEDRYTTSGAKGPGLLAEWVSLLC